MRGKNVNICFKRDSKPQPLVPQTAALDNSATLTDDLCLIRKETSAKMDTPFFLIGLNLQYGQYMRIWALNHHQRSQAKQSIAKY